MHTAREQSEIPGYNSEHSVTMERACTEKERKSWNQVSETILASGTQLPTISVQQSTNLQRSSEASLVIWNPNMGLCK